EGRKGLLRSDDRLATPLRVGPRDQGPNRLRQCLLREPLRSGSSLVLDGHLVAHLVGVGGRCLLRRGFAEQVRALDELVQLGRLTRWKRVRRDFCLPGEAGQSSSSSDRQLQRSGGRARALTRRPRSGLPPPPTPPARLA